MESDEVEMSHAESHREEKRGLWGHTWEDKGSTPGFVLAHDHFWLEFGVMWGDRG